MDSDITDGAASVQIEGNPVANLSAKISTSTGDEAGSAGGGIISSKIKGTVTWMMGSLDVKAEGKSVVRFLDTNFHNGNSFNTSFKAMGGTGLAYADDFTEPCPICKKAASEHKILETESTAKVCADIVAELRQAFRNADDKQKARYAKKGRGYMVGVMICKCNMKFAAMSGFKALPGFAEVAGPHVDKVINTGAAGDTPAALGVQDYAKANTLYGQSAEMASGIEQTVLSAYRNAGEAYGAGDSQYSLPGVCAGAHLVAKSGHAPVQMTEMFFAPTGHWPKLGTKEYSFIVGGTRQPAQFGTRVQKTEETPWGTSVASCRTCQDLLFLTMCPERTCP
jgi:hypothetical protein